MELIQYLNNTFEQFNAPLYHLQVINRVIEEEKHEKEFVEQVYLSLNFEKYKKANQKISKLANDAEENGY
ncbi:hypothetical protein ACI3EJ_11865 (plasmid) [Ligilactobacillus acidipiscis]|uniref:hypothetical protein n=1 Tax=Ligilactobacillus acidipiscis TaxID=89059 RepID=UPI0038677B89